MWSIKEPFKLSAHGPKHHPASVQAKDFPQNICAEPGIGRKVFYKSLWEASSDFIKSETPQEEAFKNISFQGGVIAPEEQEQV